MMEDNNSLTRNMLHSTYLSWVISVALVLFLLGILAVLLFQADRAVRNVKEDFQIMIVLKPDVVQTEVNELINLIGRNAAVKSVVYESKDEAAKKLTDELGEDFVSFLGYNPLNPSLDVRFKSDFVDQKNIELFKKYLSNKPVIVEFSYQKNVVSRINKNLKTIAGIVAGFSALLVLVAVIIINNTIRITLYAKRMLIKSMQLVGASKSYIRRPFLWRAVVNGCYSALIASAMVFALLWFLQKYYSNILVLNDWQLWLQLIIVLTGLGIVISLVSTFFAVNKWLSKSSVDLH